MNRITYLFLALGIMAVCGCTSTKKRQEQVPVKVKAITVGNELDSNNDEYVGTVEETIGTSLSFEVPGNISSLKVGEGNKVAKGQLLATINPTTLREAHRATLVTLRQARDAYRRFEPLHKQGTISDLRWVDVQTKLEQAEAAEATARQQLSHSSLYAPFSGVIATKSAEVGANVLPGQQVLKLISIGKVYVKLSVPENEISHIVTGSTVEITVSALGGEKFTGIIAEKGIDANPISHTYDIKVSVDNRSGKLMPGMVCNARIRYAKGNTGGNIDRQTIALPPSCVERDVDNSRFVWVIENGKAHKQNVVIGGFSGDNVSIISGINIGDRVIVEGYQKVSEGMRVTEK